MFRMAALYVLERQKPGLVAHLTLCLLQRSQRVGAQPARARPPLMRASTMYAPFLGLNPEAMLEPAVSGEGQLGVCSLRGVGDLAQL